MPLSTITTNSIADDAITVPKVTDQILTNRNLIINGAMQVAQRGTSTSSVITSIYGACDRQKYYRAGAIDETVVTISQSTDAPTGFKYSHKVQVTTAEASIDSDDLICPLHYIIEGQDLQHLSYGTSSAKAMTVSFWVRSNVTGVFSLSVYNNNSTRLVAPTYTISSADTWEYKTLAIPGDQTGTIVNTNGYGLDLYFNAMVGSSFTSGTSAANAWAAYSSSGVWCVGHTAVWGSSTSDYWQITGIQLEVGDTATPFEHRSFGEDHTLCQRYFQKSFDYAFTPANGPDTTNFATSNGKTSGYTTNNSQSASLRFATEMRTNATITKYGNSSGHGRYYPETNPAGGGWSSGAPYITTIGTGGYVYSQNVSGNTGYFVEFHWTADAEL